MALLGATMLGQSGPGSNGNEGVLCIPQGPSITGTSSSDCLMSYPGHSLVEGVLPLCRGAVSVFYSPSWMGNSHLTESPCCIINKTGFATDHLSDNLWAVTLYNLLFLGVHIRVGLTEWTFSKIPLVWPLLVPTVRVLVFNPF